MFLVLSFLCFFPLLSFACLLWRFNRASGLEKKLLNQRDLQGLRVQQRSAEVLCFCASSSNFLNQSSPNGLSEISLRNLK